MKNAKNAFLKCPIPFFHANKTSIENSMDTWKFGINMEFQLANVQ